eukprot:PRCOL_00003387-RA
MRGRRGARGARGWGGKGGKQGKRPAAPGGKGRVVYVGHIPHGFYEAQLKAFFEQFGEITRWRLSRNKKTGKSKHYAFLEFEDAGVAAIAAGAMHNYLMFDQLLQCRVMDDAEVHPDTFVGANRAFRKVPWKKLDNARRNRKRTAEEVEVQTKRLVKSEAKRRKKIAAVGIDYDFGGYVAAVSGAGGEGAGEGAEDTEQQQPETVRAAKKPKASAKQAKGAMLSPEFKLDQ